MKLNTLLINLIILGVGLSATPAQADNDKYISPGQWDFIKVKDGDDRRWRRDDDDDDRRGRDKDGIRSFGNVETAEGDNARDIPAMPRGSQLNFKERRYIRLQQQREQDEKDDREE